MNGVLIREVRDGIETLGNTENTFRGTITPTRIQRPTGGPGTELKKLLLKLGLKAAANCKCNQHVQEMNMKGCNWCSQNIDTIVGWLKEEALRANLPFTNIGAKLLVKRAISNARKAAAK
jgi:hypothetical protein